ncbi:allene oxide cyclase barrel-like domain-containing protein [Actinosynnema sp. CA-248983]
MHNKKTFTRLAAVSLVAVAVGGCSVAEGATETAARDRVEVLELGVRNEQYQSLDLGTPGLSLGDMDVYSGKAIKDGQVVGHGGGSCQVIHVEGDDVDMQCVITMNLEQGSVTMQAQWSRGVSPLDMAITGGTGTYRKARGTVRFWDIGTPNERARAEIIL